MQTLLTLLSEYMLSVKMVRPSYNGGLCRLNAMRCVRPASELSVAQFKGKKSGTVVPLCDFQYCSTVFPLNKGVSVGFLSRDARADACAPAIRALKFGTSIALNVLQLESNQRLYTPTACTGK